MTAKTKAKRKRAMTAAELELQQRFLDRQQRTFCLQFAAQMVPEGSKAGELIAEAENLYLYITAGKKPTGAVLDMVKSADGVLVADVKGRSEIIETRSDTVEQMRQRAAKPRGFPPECSPT